MSIIQLLLVPLLLAVTSQDPQKSPAMDLEDLVRKVGPSVGALRVFDRDGDLSAEGTAFVASPFASDPKKRFLVTNRHVVLGASAVQVIFPSQEPFTVGPVVAYDVVQDLVVFSLEGLPEGIVALELSPALPNVGQRLAVIGNAKGLANSVSDGVTSSTREFKDRGTMIQMSVPIYHGSSGSPVFTSNGKVVGIATSGLDDAQSINFAVPTSKLLALHCGAGIAIEIWSGASRLAPAVPIDQPKKTPLPQEEFSPPILASDSTPMGWAEVLEQNPDPKVVTDADFLKRITETKLPWRVKDKVTGIEMLLVPPGKFVMGMSPGDKEASDNEKPAHEVTLTKAFYLGRTEVTQGQWVKVMGENPSEFQVGSREKLIAKYIDEGLTKQEAQKRGAKEAPNKWVQENNPVDTVSWDDCQKFCARTGMKLPTEAQWEYACCAGVRKPRYGEFGQIAWHKGNSDSTTHPVAQKAPNALGFYDMIGNVNEWCQDLCKGDYYKSCADGVVDPTGPAQGEGYGLRVQRGGDWLNHSNYCRGSQRHGDYPGGAYNDFGFRAARTP